MPHAIDPLSPPRLVDFHTGEKGFTLSKRGELAVLDELARAMPQGGLELAEPACWGAAASNAVVARGRGAAARRLRWLALARRAVAASWCFLSFEEFVQSHADAVEGRRRALRDAPISCVAQPTAAEPTIVDAVNLAVLPISRAAAPRPLPDGTFTWTTPEEDESVPVDRRGPTCRAFGSKARRQGAVAFRGRLPVVVSAIPQIVSVHVVGSSEEDVWRVVRSALRTEEQDVPRPGGVREGCVAGVVGGVWGAIDGGDGLQREPPLCSAARFLRLPTFRR